MTRDELKSKLIDVRSDLNILLNDLNDPTASVAGINNSIEDLLHQIDTLEAAEDDWDE